MGDEQADLAHYGPKQGAELLNLKQWQFTRARERGLIPAPDVAGKRWSAVSLQPFLNEGAQARLLAVIGDHPGVGAIRAAEELSQVTGLQVERSDVNDLAEQGLLQVVGHFKDNPLYALAELQSFAAVRELQEVIASRSAWTAMSMTAKEASQLLGWSLVELSAVTAAHDIVPGPGGRIPREDIDRLVTDKAMSDAMEGDRLIGATAAAHRLKIRRSDFDYLVKALLAVPASSVTTQVGSQKIVTHHYRVADIDALGTDQRINWKAVRSCKPGAPSPLRKLL